MKKSDEIVDELLKQINHWKALGYEPEFIYLGSQEFDTLVNDKSYSVKPEAVNVFEKIQHAMLGTECLKVNRPSHISISVIKRG